MRKQGSEPLAPLIYKKEDLLAKCRVKNLVSGYPG